jgi:ribosomal protein S18 acetylase RimI-like enzyme
MIVRPASVTDIDRCVPLDGSYTTDYVWQMEDALAPETISVGLRRARIPRRVKVPYPRSPDDLLKDLQRNECFLVADEQGKILGYIDMLICHWQWRGQIEHLIVHPSYRRRGLATRLLRAATQWARTNDLRALSVAVQTKNDPAIAFFAKQGYVFCGLVDHYYNNDDIGIFYSFKL